MAEMIRADALLYQKALCPSRTAAQRAIEERRVFADGRKIIKSSEKLSPDTILRVEAPEEEYVSRGAYKLIGALNAFGLDVSGLVCADLGASTGGFTQVLVKNGAQRVYAIDVGDNQLAPILRTDPRVISMENCNARNLSEDSLPEPVDLIVYDLSFISATLLYDAMRAIGSKHVRVIGLIKPQFEAGRQAVGKNGIVKHPSDHERAILRCRDAAQIRGFQMTELSVSPIHGGDGNIEYLCLLETCEEGAISDSQVKECVKHAHNK